MDLKSTPKHRSSIPLPLCIAVRGYGIFHDISRGLETIWVVGEYLCMPHPLKLPYLDTQRPRPFICLTVRALDMSEGQGHTPYMEKNELMEDSRRSRLVTWPPCLHSFYPFFMIWNLERTHQICAGCFGKCIITKLIPKVNGKTFGIQLKNTVFYGHR